MASNDSHNSLSLVPYSEVDPALKEQFAAEVAREMAYSSQTWQDQEVAARLQTVCYDQVRGKTGYYDMSPRNLDMLARGEEPYIPAPVAALYAQGGSVADFDTATWFTDYDGDKLHDALDSAARMRERLRMPNSAMSQLNAEQIRRDNARRDNMLRHEFNAPDASHDELNSLENDDWQLRCETFATWEKAFTMELSGDELERTLRQLQADILYGDRGRSRDELNAIASTATLRALGFVIAVTVRPVHQAQIAN